MTTDGMNIFSMAWRNIEHPRRWTAVTVAAVTLALFALVVYTSMLQGMLNDRERTVVEIGDRQIHTVECLDTLILALQDARLRSSPRLVGGGLMAARKSSTRASLRGVDVTLGAEVSEISQRVADGRGLDPGDPYGVVVGRRLAYTHDVVALVQGRTDGHANMRELISYGDDRHLGEHPGGVDPDDIAQPRDTVRFLKMDDAFHDHGHATNTKKDLALFKSVLESEGT